MIHGLHTIWAPVLDMDRAVHFYETVLGLQKGFASPYWTEFHLGHEKIALHAGGKPGKQGWVLGLRCENLPALEERLRLAKATIVGTHETPNGILLEFLDPDGNRMQAIAG